MKITSTQLRKIIREEKQKIQEEAAIRKFIKNYLVESSFNEKIGTEPPGDNLGLIAEKGEWQLYAPATSEAARKLEVGWSAGQISNQFNKLTSSTWGDAIIFYLIKKDVSASTDPFASIRVGFFNGQPDFTLTGGQSNTLGVDVGSRTANGKRINREKYNSILGPDAKYFLDVMRRYSRKSEGKHLNKIELEELMSDVNLFSKKFEEAGEPLRSELVDKAVHWMRKEETFDIFKYLIDLGESSINLKIAIAASSFGSYAGGDKVVEYMVDSENLDLESARVIAADRDVGQLVLKKLLRKFPNDRELLKNAEESIAYHFSGNMPYDSAQAMVKNANLATRNLKKDNVW